MPKSDEVFCLCRALSLLPIFIFASISMTLLEDFLSAGLNAHWGVLIAFAVALALIAVFRHGVQLQKESNETM